MLGAESIVRAMQEEGKRYNAEGVIIGEMTDYNTCMIGEEIELSEEQLYFFERDTMRMCRTPKIDIPATMELIDPTEEDPDPRHHDHKKEVEENDLSVYVRPYKRGDLVALVKINERKNTEKQNQLGSRYLVLGRIIPGEDVTELVEQVEEDWEYESLTYIPDEI